MDIVWMCSHERRRPEGARRPVLWLALSILFVAVLGDTGCKRKASEPSVPEEPGLPVVYTNRMDDASYVGALMTNRAAQKQFAGERGRVLEKMAPFIEKARAALPADAPDNEVRAYLDNLKDPEWDALVAENKRLVGALDQTLEDARAVVRRRIQAERQALQDVEEGKAVAAGASEQEPPPTRVQER